MATAPNIMKSWLVSVDGRGLAGMVAETGTVNLDMKTQARRSGEEDCEVKEPLGQEAMMYKLVLYEYNKEVLSAWGQSITGKTAITIRGGAQESGEGAVEAHLVNLRVSLPSIPSEMWKPGELITPSFEFDVYYYKHVIDNEVKFEIDPANRKRIIDGVNQLDPMNAALGYNATADADGVLGGQRGFTGGGGGGVL